MRSGGALRKALLEFVRPFHAGRVAVNQGHTMKIVIFLHDVHSAPVGQAVYSELGDGHQVRLVIERRCQHSARFREKREPVGIILGFRSRDALVDQELIAFFLGSSPFDEITYLPAERIEHLQKLVIRLHDFAVIEGHDAVHVLSDTNRKRECAVQTYALGDRGARKIGVVDDVINPDRLSIGEHSTDKIDARK